MNRPEISKRENFTEKFGINEENLALRREFLRLGEEDREILMELADWAEEVSLQVARDFYDWQFSFPPTQEFFQSYAHKQNLPLEKLRNQLENSQSIYFREIFQGAKNYWGVDYFERRLHVGWVHDRIDLPFKWYIGAYGEYEYLVRKYLRESFDDSQMIGKAEQAIFKVFNYDIQAIGDSFILNTLQSLGLSVEAIETEEKKDRTEYISHVKENVNNLKLQAQALAERRLDDPVLKVKIPGKLGESFSLMVRHLTDVIERIAMSSQALSASAEELSVLSTQMSGNAEDTLQQVNSVSASVRQVSVSMESVATGTEEMTSSIEEISKNASEAAQFAGEAVKKAKETSHTVNDLERSSLSIGKVTKVINSIADQTRLLSLNATIEAARAGEAGRGFAVVASEIKNLAKQTAESTEEIGETVTSMKSTISRAVQAIGEIGKTIEQFSDIQTAIASAVEEQTYTTNEIAQNITETSQASEEILENVDSVAQTARNTSQGASSTQEAAENLTSMASEMQQILEEFSLNGGEIGKNISEN